MAEEAADKQGEATVIAAEVATRHSGADDKEATGITGHGATMMAKRVWPNERHQENGGKATATVACSGSGGRQRRATTATAAAEQEQRRL